MKPTVKKNIYFPRYIVSNRKKLLESVFVAVFVAIISLISMVLFENCQPKIKISSTNVIQVRKTLKTSYLIISMKRFNNLINLNHMS